MTTQRSERWSPGSGVLFVVLFALGAAALEANTAETPEAVREYYVEHRNRVYAGYFILLASALCLLWFVATLRSALARLEDEPRALTALGFAAGVVTSASIVAGGALFVALGEQGGELDPGSAGALDTASYFLITGGISVGALLVLATSVVARRTGLLPRWLAAAGFVVAPITFFAPLSVPALVFPAWILVVSVVLLARAANTPAELAFPP